MSQFVRKLAARILLIAVMLLTSVPTADASAWNISDVTRRIADESTVTVASVYTQAVQVAAGSDVNGNGYEHTCAVTSMGGVKCWGDNWFGQLGDGTSYNRRYTPVDVVGLESGVISIGVGAYFSCALTTTGAVKCWGDDYRGKLGDGMPGGQYGRSPIPVDVSGLGNGVVLISVGYSHACALLITSAVRCWGFAADGSQTIQSTPVDISGIDNVVSISAGQSHTCVLSGGGGVKCWGDNYYGQLGDGRHSSWSAVPVDVVGLGVGVSFISAARQRTCALMKVGGVKCWGRAYLGDGTSSNRYTPVDVIGLGSEVTAIATGGYTACAAIGGGGVKCWGQVYTTAESSPVSVIGLQDQTVQMSLGFGQKCAVTQDGGLKCWGANYSGQLGDGTTTNRYPPVDVVGFGPAESQMPPAPVPSGNPLPPVAGLGTSFDPNGDTIQILATDYKLDGAYASNMPPDWWSGLPSVPKPTTNRMTVGVKWGVRTPGRIDALRSGALIASKQAGQTTDLQVNLLALLPPNGTAPLEVQAYDAQGSLVGRKVFAGRSYAISDFLFERILAIRQDVALKYDPLQRTAVLDMSLVIPPEYLTSMIDFLGEDSKFGWKDLQLVGKVSLALGGDELEVSVGAKQGARQDQRRSKYFNGQIRLGKAELTLEPELGAVARITDQGAKFVKIKGSVLIVVSLTDKYGPVKLLVLVLDLVAPPAGTTLLSNPVTGPALDALDGALSNNVYAYTKLSGKVGGEAEYDIEASQLTALSLIGGLGVEFGVKAELPEMGVSIGAALGGEATAKFRIAPQSCQSLELAGYAKTWAYVLVFNNEWEGRLEHEFTNCPTMALRHESASAAQLFAQGKNASPWHLSGGGYSGTYSVDRAAKDGARMTRPAAGEVASAQPLVTNVYTNAMPAFAPLGQGNGIALWTHDIPTRPLGQNLDIAYATLSNGSWSTTKRVTDDTFLDSAPTAGGVGNTVVSAWMRLNNPALPADTTLDVTATKKFDIGSAVFVSATQSWSAVSVVGKPDALDHSPVVATTADGTGRVAWMQNDEGLFTGNNRIMVSRVTSASLEAPTVVISGVDDINQLSMAASAGGDTLAFVRTISHTNGVSNTSAIFLTTQISGTWASPQSVTPLDTVATSARLIYLSGGSLTLVYRLGGRLVVQSTETGQSTLGPQVDDGAFAVSPMPNNGLSAVFSHSRDGQFDLYVSYFDGAASVWSEPQRLTQDKSLELWPSVVSSGPGSIAVVYARTSMISTTASITGANGLSTTVSYLSRGQTDLYQLGFTYARNIGIDSLNVDTTSVSAGQAMTVATVITNSGQLPVKDFAVSLARNGVEVTRTTVVTWLAGGDRITVELPFVPAIGMPLSTFSVTVDADNQLSETLKTDNVASFTALGPDLSLESLYADVASSQVLAHIRNSGLYSTPQTAVGMWISDGARITVTSAWLLPLGPGADMIVALPLTGALQSTQPLTAIVDVNPNGFSFAEVDRTNNATSIKVGGTSYLAFASSTATVPESGLVTVTIRNLGATDSGPFTVTLFVSPTLEITGLLAASLQPALGAGAERLVPLSLPQSSQCATFARITTENSDVATASANVAVLTQQRPACVVFTNQLNLPLVMR